MKTDTKQVVLDHAWTKRPLIARTEGEHLAAHLGLRNASTIHIVLDEQVVAMEGFWLGLCDSFIACSSTLADLYSRAKLVRATPTQRRAFERAMCRAMGKAYTQTCKIL